MTNEQGAQPRDTQNTAWQIRRAMTSLKITPALWEPWIAHIEALEAEVARLNGEVESMRAERLERDRALIAAGDLAEVMQEYSKYSDWVPQKAYDALADFRAALQEKTNDQ